MIRQRHIITFETDKGLLKFDIRETGYLLEGFTIYINIYFQTRKDKRFLTIGHANLNVYIGYNDLFKHIYDCDASQWEQDFVHEVYDFETESLKPHYDNGHLKELDFFSEPFFSLSHIQVKEAYKGFGILKKVIDTLQDLYHVGVIMAKPMPLQNYDMASSNYEQVYKNDLIKLCSHYKSVGFEFINADGLYCFYWLNGNETPNFYEQDKSFFKKNTILWAQYRTEFVQSLIEK